MSSGKCFNDRLEIYREDCYGYFENHTAKKVRNKKMQSDHLLILEFLPHACKRNFKVNFVYVKYHIIAFFYQW